MSVLTDIWRQLVRRRLLPVALLLVAALVAVPMLLAKEPEPTETAAPATPVETADSDLAEAPIVTASEVSTRQKGRKVLGDKHDIFKSTVKKPKVAKKSDDERRRRRRRTRPRSRPTTAPAAVESDAGGGTPSAPTTPAAPAPKPKTYPLYSLKVRFSGGEGESVKGYLPVRAALPSTEQPADHLPRPDERPQVRRLHARLDGPGGRRRRVQPDARELRDRAHARGRHDVLRRRRRGRDRLRCPVPDRPPRHQQEADDERRQGSRSRPGSRRSRPPRRSAAASRSAAWASSPAPAEPATDAASARRSLVGFRACRCASSPPGRVTGPASPPSSKVSPPVSSSTARRSTTTWRAASSATAAAGG